MFSINESPLIYKNSFLSFAFTKSNNTNFIDRSRVNISEQIS